MDEVSRDRLLADGEDPTNLPRRLTLHRPLEHVSPARRQNPKRSGKALPRDQQPRRHPLCTTGKQQQLSSLPPAVLRVTWKRLIAIDTHQEVPAGWQVERQGNAATVAMLGLLFPEIPASARTYVPWCELMGCAFRLQCCITGPDGTW